MGPDQATLGEIRRDYMRLGEIRENWARFGPITCLGLLLAQIPPNLAARSGEIRRDLDQ